MSKLLLNKELRKELFSYAKLNSIEDKKLREELSTVLDKLDKDNPVRDVARTQTITILRRLEGDKKRQERIISFLRDVKLCNFIFKKANLSEIDLLKANLYKVNFQEADLTRANLQGAILSKVDFKKAELTQANLKESELYEVDLQEANLYKVNLQEANLTRANLKKAYFVEVQKYTSQQIKSACFWKEAFYKADFDFASSIYKVSESDNKNFIEELKNDTASDPEEPPDCSWWENSNEAD